MLSLTLPLLEKTILHMRRYLKEFHSPDLKSDAPLFYSKTHEEIHSLSSDTFEKMIKRYADQCRAAGYPMPDHVHCHMIRLQEIQSMFAYGDKGWSSEAEMIENMAHFNEWSDNLPYYRNVRDEGGIINAG